MVTDYALDFCTVAAGSGFGTSQRTVRRFGMSSVWTAMRSWPHELLAFANRLDHLKHGATSASHRPAVTCALQLPLPSAPALRQPLVPKPRPKLGPEEPMQVNSSRLSSGERLHQLYGGLCLYCGTHRPFCFSSPDRLKRPSFCG